MTLLKTQTSETKCRLTTATVLLGQIDSELVQYSTSISLQGGIQTAVTIHHNKPEDIIVFQQFVQWLTKNKISDDLTNRVSVNSPQYGTYCHTSTETC